MPLLLVPFCLLLWYGFKNSTHHPGNSPFRIKWEKETETRAYYFKNDTHTAEKILPGKLIFNADEKTVTWDFPLPAQRDIYARFKIECQPSGQALSPPLQFDINDRSLVTYSVKKK